METRHLFKAKRLRSLERITDALPAFERNRHRCARFDVAVLIVGVFCEGRKRRCFLDAEGDFSDLHGAYSYF